MADPNDTTDAAEQAEEGAQAPRQAPSEFTAITSKGKKVQFVKGNMPDSDWTKLWESSKRASAETGVTKKHFEQAQEGGAKVTGPGVPQKSVEQKPSLAKRIAKGAETALTAAALPGIPAPIVEAGGEALKAVTGAPTLGAAVMKGVNAGVEATKDYNRFLGDAAQGIGGVGKQVAGELIGSPEMVASGEAMAEKAWQSIAAGAPVPPPDRPEDVTAAGAQPQDQTQAQPAMDASAGVGMVGATPTFRGAVAAKADNTAINEAIQGVQANQKQLQAALDNENKIREANLIDQQKAQLDQEKIILETADRQRMALMRRQEEADKYAARADEIRQQARQAASDPIDPNRFWNNKNIGQKAAAVIAGALFGFTGQGMQWLQRLDSLVAEDMRVQESDRASRAGGLREEAAGLGEAAKMALARGANEAEAMNIDRTARLEAIKTKLDLMVQQTQNAEVKTRGVQMSGEISNRIAGLEVQRQQMAEHEADRKTQVSIANAKEANDISAMMAQASMKGAGGVEMDPETVRKIGATREMITIVDKMRALTADEGFLDRIGRLKDEFLSDEERAKKATYKLLSMQLAKGFAGSALQKHEEELLMPVIGDRTNVVYSAAPKFDAIRSALLGEMKGQLQGALYGKTGNYQTMAQDYANLEAQSAPLPTQKEKK